MIALLLALAIPTQPRHVVTPEDKIRAALRAGYANVVTECQRHPPKHDLNLLIHTPIGLYAVTCHAGGVTSPLIRITEEPAHAPAPDPY